MRRLRRRRGLRCGIVGMLCVCLGDLAPRRGRQQLCDLPAWYIPCNVRDTGVSGNGGLRWQLRVREARACAAGHAHRSSCEQVERMQLDHIERHIYLPPDPFESHHRHLRRAGGAGCRASVRLLRRGVRAPHGAACVCTRRGNIQINDRSSSGCEEWGERRSCSHVVCRRALFLVSEGKLFHPK